MDNGTVLHKKFIPKMTSPARCHGESGLCDVHPSSALTKQLHEMPLVVRSLRPFHFVVTLRSHRAYISLSRACPAPAPMIESVYFEAVEAQLKGFHWVFVVAFFCP